MNKTKHKKIQSFINISDKDLKEIQKKYKNYGYFDNTYTYFIVDCFYNVENLFRDILDEKIMNIQDFIRTDFGNLDDINVWIDMFSFSELNCGVEYLFVNDKFYKVVL